MVVKSPGTGTCVTNRIEFVGPAVGPARTSNGDKSANPTNAHANNLFFILQDARLSRKATLRRIPRLFNKQGNRPLGQQTSKPPCILYVARTAKHLQCLESFFLILTGFTASSPLSQFWTVSHQSSCCLHKVIAFSGADAPLNPE